MGLRWKIGNDRTASLLHSNWILGIHPDLLVFNPRVLPHGGDLPVAEVLCQWEGRWDDGKLNQWFDPATCRVIKTILVPRHNIEDRLI
ncbi:unnamed protein product [Linum trigynum]|uniref:Uncharacterized protein n=1 Tax=Linum trigynum TaxID=586398 RepID=A0AAV2D0U7_9ROSI